MDDDRNDRRGWKYASQGMQSEHVRHAFRVAFERDRDFSFETVSKRKRKKEEIITITIIIKISINDQGRNSKMYAEQTEEDEQESRGEIRMTAKEE